MTIKKEFKTPSVLDEQKGPADSPIKTLSETKSVQSISILYGGIHSMSQFIEIYLEKAFSKFHMSIEIANSDDLFWRINEITCAYEKFHYDLCILWLNNVIAPPNRMEAVCSLIKTLTTDYSTKIIGLYGCHDNYWPKRFIAAGAQIVYHMLFERKQFIDDFPVVMGWETRENFERIVQ